jgi:osmotically-inducible protein OsmY
MTSWSVLLVAALAASMACREDSAAQPHEAPEYAQTQPPEAASSASVSNAVVPQNPADRSIRRELNLAIDRDPDLKDRDLSFIVGNGDVNVTGIVRSESERERINALAMSISGVKSIANAVRVAP